MQVYKMQNDVDVYLHDKMQENGLKCNYEKLLDLTANVVNAMWLWKPFKWNAMYIGPKCNKKWNGGLNANAKWFWKDELNKCNAKWT